MIITRGTNRLVASEWRALLEAAGATLNGGGRWPF